MKNIAVIGANGAIGSAFVTQFVERHDVGYVHAFSRSPFFEQSPKIINSLIDFENEASIEMAAEKASQLMPLDIVVVATGILHQGDIQPEKSLRDLSIEKFNHIFAINTIGPALLMKHFLPKLHKDQRALFGILSAKVGSISENELGGWYAYRASKAALNMLIKNASIEMARRYKEMVIVGLHPGTVDSPLSKPFQSYVSPDHLFTPAYAVEQMIQVLDNLKPHESGNCFAYDGALINP